MPTRVLRPPALQALADELLRGWAAIPTTIACDVFAGRTLVDPRIRPLRPFSGARLCGPVITGWCEPADLGAPLHVIALAKAGDVIAIDAGGCLQSAVVGEHLCGAARRKGVAGIVVNGAVRDIAALASWPDFPVFALGHSARGPVSIERGTVNDALAFGGVALRPHDLILGDDDGLVVIPREQAQAMLAAAQAKVRLEEAWDRRLSAGEGILDVFAVPPATG